MSNIPFTLALNELVIHLNINLGNQQKKQNLKFNKQLYSIHILLFLLLRYLSYLLLEKCSFSVKKFIFSGLANPLWNKGQPRKKSLPNLKVTRKKLCNFLYPQPLSWSAHRHKGTLPWITSFRYLLKISD